MLYKSCRYSVHREYAYSTVKYKITTGRINIYDNDLNFICTHLLSERKGSYSQLPEHRKGESGDWIDIMERLRSQWNCYDFQHFINGFKKENPRHIAKQLGAVEQFLNAENRNYSAAHFPPSIRPLEEFDPEELESGITQAQLDRLKELSWLDNGGNLVFAGPPGLGKTMVATGLGLHAINNG